MTVHRVLRMCRTGLWLSAIWALICGVIWACQGYLYPALACFAIMAATAIAGWRIDPDVERRGFPPAMRPGLADDCGCTLIYGPGRVDKIRCPGHADPTSVELLLEAMSP